MPFITFTLILLLFIFNKLRAVYINIANKNKVLLIALYILIKVIKSK